MNKKKNRIDLLFALFFIGLFSINFNSIIPDVGNSLLNNSDKNSQLDDFIPDGISDEEPSQPVPSRGDGYNTSYVAEFDVIENASSIITEREFNATQGNIFNISTPKNWSISSMQLDLESYHKNQTLKDTVFESGENGEIWENEDYLQGFSHGTFDQDWIPESSTPEAVYTSIFHDPAFEGALGFGQGSYAYWDQTIENDNPDRLPIQRGQLYQPKDESVENFEAFDEFEPGFSFNKDDNTPYGGYYEPEGPTHDTVDLYTELGALVVDITPYQYYSTSNPSAAWWSNISIPYEADYAQITINWSISTESTFRDNNDYEVRARINNKYIDGTKWISKSDSLPYNGSSEALIVYNDSDYLYHDNITSRTYDITDLIDGLVGVNKFDFGVWARNPSHSGEIERIKAIFDSVEIQYNTSDKYEVACLEFDYLAIENANMGGGSVEDDDDPDIIVNKASLVLELENYSDDTRIIRVLPFNDLIKYDALAIIKTPIHVQYSLPQEYEHFLYSNNEDVEFKFGVLFESHYYDAIDYYITFDNVTFTMNYKHKPIIYSDLLVKMDDKLPWNTINTNRIKVNISNWSPGQNHSYEFRSNKLEFSKNLFLNIKSKLKLNITGDITNGSLARYDIPTTNSDYGFWNITYDNTFSYSLLTQLNSTPYFNISSYDISYIDLPAFDSNGSNSKNWEVLYAYSPGFLNFSQNIIRFNYSANSNNQSAKIRNACGIGNWTLRVRQMNYITDCGLNQSGFDFGTPLFYRNQILEYNFTLAEDSINGNYSVSVLNASGDTMMTFPRHLSSTGKNVIGSFNFSIDIFTVGIYFLLIKWNDTYTTLDKTLRFGSIVKSFALRNATIAEFKYKDTSVVPGEIANFTINYRTIYDNWNIKDATIVVKENSTGFWKEWGVAWMGAPQIGNITYENGNYSIPLLTEGAPNGTYTIRFRISYQQHQIQLLYTQLSIQGVNIISVDITYGAYLDGQSKWVIDSSNIPYVNDTINSLIQVNITDSISKNPIDNGQVIGNIGGENGSYFEATFVGNGLYNLTLDTTGLDATPTGQNNTLYITCIANQYITIRIYVNITIAKIPTSVILQDIDPVYAEGEISILSTMYTHINSKIPATYDHGNLTYYIYNKTTYYKNETLDFLMSGVYSKDILLSGISAGNYSLKVITNTKNCEWNQSNILNFTIIAQFKTNLNLTLPETIRIKREFKIITKLSYENKTIIPNQIIKLNITLKEKGNTGGISFVVSTITNSKGISNYDYTISEDYDKGSITVNATFEGTMKIQASNDGKTKPILGKISIFLNITEHPNNTARVGYSATYSLQIDIKDPGEDIDNLMIFFLAYYEKESSPFTTQQLYTNAKGECSYTIPEIADEKNNLTVSFEFFGSETVSYNITLRTDLIIPKWNSNFSYTSLPSKIRFGQMLLFDIEVFCENDSIELEGLSVVFTFRYGSKTEIYTQYIDENNEISFSYNVADSFSGKLNITIEFLGTNKIDSYSESTLYTIDEKIRVIVEFVEEPQPRYLLGRHSFTVKVTDENGEPLENLEIIFEILDSRGNVIVSATTTTDQDGIASASLNIEEVGNNFILSVRFAGEGFYEASESLEVNIRIVNEFMMILELVPYILIAAAIVAGIWLSIYRGVVIPKRNRERELLKQMYQKLSDVENLQYLLVIEKEGGVPMFSKSLADVPIDESLISGFLTAISSFGAEIGAKMKDQEVQGGLEELSYRQFKIILNEGTYVKIALLLLKKPSETLKAKLRHFNIAFEEQYKDVAAKWDGRVLRDNEVSPLIEQIFEADLLYPHQVIESKVADYIKELSRKDVTKKILVIARGEEFESNFYLRDMINHLKTTGIEEIKSFERLEKIKNDRIVFAINPRTNYLIEQLSPYIKFLTTDDRNILFAIFDGAFDEINIRKYLKKKGIQLSEDANMDIIFQKLKKMNLIEEDNTINNTGSAVATLLRLIPDL